jgi:hypothetical protein
LEKATLYEHTILRKENILAFSVFIIGDKYQNCPLIKNGLQLKAKDHNVNIKLKGIYGMFKHSQLERNMKQGTMPFSD